VKPVFVLSGPNLGRLGTREPEVYGGATYADLVAACERTGADLGLTVVMAQTDDEAEMIRLLHRAADEASGVVLNPGAWGHYSYALHDAVGLVEVPVVEVHISNPQARDEFRHTSVISGVVHATIAGFGQTSYLLALRGLADVFGGPSTS
jgi:3-dehydroquinate dehydratase II